MEEGMKGKRVGTLRF